jgi:hypothetical protein
VARIGQAHEASGSGRQPAGQLLDHGQRAVGIVFAGEDQNGHLTAPVTLQGSKRRASSGPAKAVECLDDPVLVLVAPLVLATMTSAGMIGEQSRVGERDVPAEAAAEHDRRAQPPCGTTDGPDTSNHMDTSPG